MNFEESVRKAAKRADHAVQRTMKEYRDGFITDEDDITGVLVGGLKAELDGQIGGLTWSASIARHRRGWPRRKKISALIL